jgi:looped-hinge helix DNA binding domain, AbrB family
MGDLATITAKGQITLPKEVREQLGLRPKDKLLVMVQGDHIVLIPIRRRSLTELQGVFHVDRPFPGLQAVREKLRYELGRRIAEGEE